MLTPTLSTPNNFAAQRREAMLGAIPRVALDGMDVYVAGAQSFAHLGETASGVLNVGCVGLGGLHLISGIRAINKASNESDRSASLRAQATGYGEVITALGYVGLAAGMGAWALPFIAIGLTTTNYARFA